MKIVKQPVKDKYRTLKRVLIILGIMIIIAMILTIVFFTDFFTKPKNTIVLENPLKDIIIRNTDAQGQVNTDAVIQQGIQEFNINYINYLLAALGVNKLHKSLVGYGNPIVEFHLDNEVWSSEIIKGGLNTQKAPAQDLDLKIIISKQEAVLALLSPNIEQFMKDSVYNGNTKIEMIAGKVELGSKGYLAMYTQLTGEEVEE